MKRGILFPLHKMVKKAHANGALFHTDAVQALGKVVLNLEKLGVDFASFSAHKFYALKGCGLLYSKSPHVLLPLLQGGGQEAYRRAGTENPLAIASLGEMCKKAEAIPYFQEKMAQIRNQMEADLLSHLPHALIVGRGQKRLANSSCLILEDMDGESLLMKMDMENFALSQGSACSSGRTETSSALKAMGFSSQQVQGQLRISLGWETTQEEVEMFVEKLLKAALQLQRNKQKVDSYPAGKDFQ